MAIRERVSTFVVVVGTIGNREINQNHNQSVNQTKRSSLSWCGGRTQKDHKLQLTGHSGGGRKVTGGSASSSTVCLLKRMEENECGLGGKIPIPHHRELTDDDSSFD